MITQLIHLTWFLGSELVADLKAKTKSSTPCGSPGTGLPTPGLGSSILRKSVAVKTAGTLMLNHVLDGYKLNNKIS